MAFLIEKLTQKQREQFEMKQIRNPLSPVLGFLKPSEWIIDIGKDVFLFAIGVHRDYPNEELFFFHWRDMEFILPLKKENKLPNTSVACQAKRKKVTHKTQKTALIYPIY